MRNRRGYQFKTMLRNAFVDKKTDDKCDLRDDYQ